MPRNHAIEMLKTRPKNRLTPNRLYARTIRRYRNIKLQNHRDEPQVIAKTSHNAFIKHFEEKDMS